MHQPGRTDGRKSSLPPPTHAAVSSHPHTANTSPPRRLPSLLRRLPSGNHLAASWSAISSPTAAISPSTLLVANADATWSASLVCNLADAPCSPSLVCRLFFDAQMDPSKRSSERTPFKDLSNTISTNTIHGGEPTDGRERGRQRRQIYAQMDPQKKDELLKKRRESYQQKKAKLQCTHPVTNSGESIGGPSALTTLESQPAVKGQNAMHTEDVVPAANEVFQLQSPHMSSQGQQSFMTDNVDIAVLTVKVLRSQCLQSTSRQTNYMRRPVVSCTGISPNGTLGRKVRKVRINTGREGL
nr:uncharacterized protein LOC127307855 isoform X4 [Lolium perenne]